MSATAAEYKMELTHDIHAFYRRTGTILNHEELEWLGLKYDDSSPIFGNSTVHIIIDFCRHYGDYHIVTMTEPGRLENRYVPDNGVYYLAKGDKNPNLAVNPFVGPNAELFAERAMQTALAIVSDMERGDKPK